MMDDPRYDLWYSPNFPIVGTETWRRNGKDRELLAFVDTMEEHIRRFGVRYPIGVHIRPAGTEIRPGKCRVTALLRLGRTTCPAIIADFTRSGARSPDWVRLPHSAQAIQDQFFAGGDSQVEVSHRFFSIKKRETVRRPGQEDAFARELRAAGVSGGTSGS
jgi:hypothetical protein